MLKNEYIQFESNCCLDFLSIIFIAKFRCLKDIHISLKLEWFKKFGADFLVLSSSEYLEVDFFISKTLQDIKLKKKNHLKQYLNERE